MKAHLPLVGILGLVFFLQSYTASLIKSPTRDEPIHIAAGLSYVETGRIVVNREHPPLLKEMSGILLRASGVRWPKSPEAEAALNGARPNEKLENGIIADNKPDRVLFWARLPLILLNTLFLIAVYFFGRQLLGNTAAIGATLLYALDPNMLAHSYLVATDAGMTGFIVTSLLGLWVYLRKPGWKRAIVCGLALGAALTAKFSAVVLLPVLGVLLVAAVIWPIQAAAVNDPTPTGRNALCSCGSGKKYKHCHGKREGGPTRSTVGTEMRRRAVQYAMGIVVMLAVAFVLIEAVYFFPTDAFPYLTGLRMVNANHDPNFQAYMAGSLAPRFYSYYLVAYFLKEPVAAIILTLIGLVVVVRGRNTLPLARVFVLVPMTALFVGYTLFSDNIGIRYILPVLPFTYLLGGAGLAALLENSAMWRRALAVVLCGWLMVAAIGIYPDHLSYFNEASCLLDDPKKIGLDGGTRCGPSWLDDSNVDWGQGIKQLKAWLDQNQKGRTIHLGSFSTFPPEEYGIQFVPMTDEDLLTGQTPGLYAVSSHIIASTPAIAQKSLGKGAEWLRTTPPLAIVGHAYYIFEIPEKK